MTTAKTIINSEDLSSSFNRCEKCNAYIIEPLFYEETDKRGLIPGVLCEGCNFLCKKCAGVGAIVEVDIDGGKIAVYYCETCLKEKKSNLQDNEHIIY